MSTTSHVLAAWFSTAVPRVLWFLQLVLLYVLIVRTAGPPVILRLVTTVGNVRSVNPMVRPMHNILGALGALVDAFFTVSPAFSAGYTTGAGPRWTRTGPRRTRTGPRRSRAASKRTRAASKRTRTAFRHI